MTTTVLVAHAPDEEELAEQLAEPLRQAGYEVAYRGTVLVGESFEEEASKVLQLGGPVVLCGTVNAIGTGWAHRLVHAARSGQQQTRIFAVQMQKGAYVEALSLDGRVAAYWQDPTRAVAELLDALRKYYPPGRRRRSARVAGTGAAEQRYRRLALQSCDLIDLVNLPETDRHVATRELELRRLYVPLRVHVEMPSGDGTGPDAFEQLKLRRATVRRGPAGEVGRPGGPAPTERVSVGERLAAARRLVVLGDPGAGKTTLLRWLATAYLLRLSADPDWKDLPDVATLPEQDLLPVILRCRDLDPAGVRGSIDDVLQHTLRQAEMSEPECVALRKVFRSRMRAGSALLLVDGLDEIADPRARARLCRQLERVHIAYPDCPIVVTSRIVGYREMGYRLGRGFEHATVAELSRADKDDFARRWCAVTQPPERASTAAQELVRDIHSTDRIESLTGNPMLLTTMALIRRKVGKLPSRRAELYWEAVQVLLNWRSEVDEPVDQNEAVPQLQYLAYAMCDRGTQQVREDEIVDLLRRMREEYPHVHAVRNRTPEEFLRLLERRTGIIVEAGRVRHHGRPVPVFEFRHLTVQEYLAGLALVEGRFPGRDRTLRLADLVAPLAAQTAPEVVYLDGSEEHVVAESWREPIRLCVASCNDDDVDDVLLAVLGPATDAPSQQTRARTVLATLCLSDEPNVSAEASDTVLRRVVDHLQVGRELSLSTLDQAAFELATTRWGPALQKKLVQHFLDQGKRALDAGAVAADMSRATVTVAASDAVGWLREQATRITAGAEPEAAIAALEVMNQRWAELYDHLPGTRFSADVIAASGIVDALVSGLDRGGAVLTACAWALWWITGPRPDSDSRIVVFTEEANRRLLAHLYDRDVSPWGVRFLLGAVQPAPETQSAVTAHAEDPDRAVRREVAAALQRLGDPAGLGVAVRLVDDKDAKVRAKAIEALPSLADAGNVAQLAALVSHRDEAVREAVAHGQRRVGGPNAVRQLQRQLADPSPAVRTFAAEALGHLGDRGSAPTLRDMLADRGQRVAAAAAEAIGRLGGTGVFDLLAERFDSAGTTVQVGLVKGLAALADPRSSALLERAAGSGAADVRAAALTALAELDPPAGVSAALAQLASRSKAVTDAVVGVLTDRMDTEVRTLLLGELAGRSRRRAHAAFRALVWAVPDEVDQRLLTRDLDNLEPVLDRLKWITEERVAAAASRAGLTRQEVTQRYERLADEYGLRLAWRDHALHPDD